MEGWEGRGQEGKIDGGVEDHSFPLQSGDWDRRKQEGRLPSPTVPSQQHHTHKPPQLLNVIHWSRTKQKQPKAKYETFSVVIECVASNEDAAPSRPAS